MQKGSQSGARVGRFHERFADKKSMKTGGAECFHVRARKDAALGHARDAGGHEITEAQRRIKRDFKSVEIAIIHADDFCS